MQLIPDAVPIQHISRTPAALRERLQGMLEDLVRQQIIAPVTEPTPWINSDDHKEALLLWGHPRIIV